MAKGNKNKRQTPEKVTQREEGRMETPMRGKGINEGDKFLHSGGKGVVCCRATYWQQIAGSRIRNS
jgi:hypothetical protein